MRFGILTFSRANNYGAVLQAFALQKKLRDKGQESFLVNYRCPRIDAMHASKKFKKDLPLKQNGVNFLWNFMFYPRMRMFDAFRRDVSTRRAYRPDTIAQANQDFDAFLTGSDQVFNLKLTGGDSAYFLDFVAQGKLRAGYAVSMGEYLDEYDRVYREELPKFDLLSFREKTGSDILRDRLGLDSEVVPDPTLLYTKEQWIDLLGLEEKAKRPGKPYLLLYALTQEPEMFEIAQRIAKERGLEVHMVTREVFPKGKADKYLRCISPTQFVEAIQHADYVVTPSFHGMVFSLLFGRPFTITKPPRLPERITDLLDELGIPSRYTTDPTHWDGSPIDYEGQVWPRLAAVRARGEDYLDRVIAAAQARV